MNNAQSIVKGIRDGIQNSPKGYQVEKESTQSPAIDYKRASPGTLLDFENPIPTDNPIAAFNPYSMNPHNGTHFMDYIAKQPAYPDPTLLLKPNPADLMQAIAEPHHKVTDGSGDIWQSHWQLMNNRYKGYSPNQSYR